MPPESTPMPPMPPAPPDADSPIARHLVKGRDGARLFQKRIIDVEVRFAARAGSVPTLEGSVSCAVGDALVTGTRAELWPVPRAIFEQKYDAVAPTVMGQAGCYRTRAATVLAVRLDGHLRLALPSGKGILTGDAGDWLVQYGDADQGIVNNAIFDETYERLA